MSFIRVNDAVFVDAPHAIQAARTEKVSPANASGEGKAVTKFVIRMLDVLISASALVFFSPILIAVGCLVFFQDRGPIFFGQRRIGLNGKEFVCFKFRSMVSNAGQRLQRYLAENADARIEWAKDHKLKNDPRITRLGRFIRKTSLDEFPQLWNVLKGEMSLVGPRPIVQAEVCKYGLSFSKYTSVKPGITGLWQVAGRNDVTYSRRVAMDRFFSKRTSIAFYLFILVMTVPAVLRQRGSY
jgi:exopolysaccharide production protein ExoY